ncbi:hypothetical protein RUM43_010144 [Polyplax serrata]|uniref:Uncharacterized protein n=1 Tax=Polyplax serrata TaxID=468196 RepID=A0AAN8NZY9_POLSC
MSEKEMVGTVPDKLLKTLNVNGKDGKMSGGRSERSENTIIQVHQCLSQRKTKIQKEKDVVSGSPILKTNDGRRIADPLVNFFRHLSPCDLFDGSKKASQVSLPPFGIF